MPSSCAIDALKAHYQRLSQLNLLDLFKQNPQRAKDFTLELDGVYFDFSKNNINEQTLDLLLDFAKQQNLTTKIQAMFNGEKINNTEI